MKDSAAGSRRIRRTDEGGNSRTEERRRKIYMLARELDWNASQVNGLAKRMFQVERQEWLTPVQCSKLIEGMKAILNRRKQERDST